MKEEEERKRRQEEEEENKFDFTSYLLDKKTKKNARQGFKNRGGGVSSSNAMKNGGLGAR